MHPHIDWTREGTEILKQICDAYCEDPNVITVKYPHNALCNYYVCEVNVYDQKFTYSEHAFQCKFAKHVVRNDLAQDILTTPEWANSITSRVPPHVSGTWHGEKGDL